MLPLNSITKKKKKKNGVVVWKTFIDIFNSLILSSHLFASDKINVPEIFECQREMFIYLRIRTNDFIRSFVKFTETIAT